MKIYKSELELENGIKISTEINSSGRIEYKVFKNSTLIEEGEEKGYHELSDSAAETAAIKNNSYRSLNDEELEKEKMFAKVLHWEQLFSSEMTKRFND